MLDCFFDRGSLATQACIRSLPEPFSWLVEFIRCTIVFSACPMIRDWRTFFCVDWIMAQVTIVKWMLLGKLQN